MKELYKISIPIYKDALFVFFGSKKDCQQALMENGMCEEEARCFNPSDTAQGYFIYFEKDGVYLIWMPEMPEKDSFADDCKRLYKERDEWKAKYEQKRNSCELYENEATKLHGLIKEADKRIAFLLKHCPFWVRWMYRKQFEKGGY